MLCRKEERDPRRCLAEGADLTACGVEFLRKVKNLCRAEFDAYASCIDKGSQHCLVSPSVVPPDRRPAACPPWSGGRGTWRRRTPVCRCYKERRPWDECIRSSMGMEPRDVGYFVKPHVHRSERALPAVDLRQTRDYEAEAKAVRSLTQPCPSAIAPIDLYRFAHLSPCPTVML